MPELQKIDDELGDEVVLITVATSGSDERVLRTALRAGLTAPIVRSTGELARGYGVNAVPWTVVIGRDGKPRHAFRGARSGETFRQAAKGALGQ